MRYVAVWALVIMFLAVWSVAVEAEQSRLEEWRDYIEIVGEEYGICPELIECRSNGTSGRGRSA